MYADARRNASPSDIGPGDDVLVCQEVRNKLDTPFHPTPHHVVARHGNQVTVESPEGVRYKRNTTHVKRFISTSATEPPSTLLSLEADKSLDSTPSDYVPPAPVASPAKAVRTPVHSPTPELRTRPVRESKLPDKYKDFVVKIE